MRNLRTDRWEAMVMFRWVEEYGIGVDSMVKRGWRTVCKDYIVAAGHYICQV